MKYKNALLKILGLFILIVLISPTDAFSHGSVVKRKKCRWWKKNKAEVSIDRYSYNYVPGYYYYNYYYNTSCNCWIQYVAYQPGYYTGGWSQVQHQKKKGCPNASASRSYSYNGNRNASASASVTSSSASLTTSTNHWTLRCGEGNEEPFPCEGEDGASSGHLDSNVEYGENTIELSDINGEMAIANNTPFAGVLRIRGFESFLTEEMTEEEQDLQDNTDMEKHSFFSLEIRLINGDLSIVSDAEQGVIADFVDGIEITADGDFFTANFNNLSQSIPVPEEVNPDNVSLEFFMDTYYDMSEVDTCIEENTPAPEENQENMTPTKKENNDMPNNLKANQLETESYPNPFNNKTTINFNLSEETNADLSVFDATGQLITQLLEENTLVKGEHQIVFDGSQLAKGVYYCILKTPYGSTTEKLILQ